jgi:hypothetical protein
VFALLGYCNYKGHSNENRKNMYKIGNMKQPAINLLYVRWPYRAGTQSQLVVVTYGESLSMSC